MKKNFIYALVSAIALTGAAGFTSCSSTDDVGEVNPNYDAAKNEVLTQFVCNISTGNTPMTRMNSANTQASIATDATEKFRGFTDALVLAYQLGVNNSGKVINTATDANRSYELGQLVGADGLKPSSTTANSPISHRVVELTLPVETNALMVWGKAIKTGTDDQQGKITRTIPSDPKKISDFKFSLEPRITSDNRTAFEQYQAAIAYAINLVMGTSFTGNATFGSTTLSNITVKWSDYVTISTSAIASKEKEPINSSMSMTPLGEILADAFRNVNTVATGEVRAGSAPSVQLIMKELYTVINKVASASPTSIEEQVAKLVAEAILTNIGKSFVNPLTDCSWKGVSNWVTDTGYAGLTDKMTSAFTNFPKDPFNVPLGACQLSVGYTVDNASTADVNEQAVTWSYNTNLSPTTIAGDAATAYNYMYPAELCYFGNSPIRVSSDPHIPNDYPDGVGNWNNDNSWIAGATGSGSVAWEKDSYVHSTTRSVAMQHNINYGTALLKSTVTYGAATLKDNNHAIQKAKTPSLADNQELDKQITVTGSSFTLTGIIIGGQAQDMGWNYVRFNDSGNFDKMIYDKALPSTAISGTVNEKSTPNYTLVWDNWNSASKGNKQNDVYVALEFVNGTGVDFWGNANLIHNGQTFYIVGKLNPDKTNANTDLSTTDLSAGITWPANYALPPYDATINPYGTIKERRVFIQDFMTTANFVIGENSLKSAYVTVPDLRSTQISLGLSVDCSWQTGLTYDVILGE